MNWFQGGEGRRSRCEFQRAAVDQEPIYRVREIRIDGFDSTAKELVKNKFPISREFENGAVVPFPAAFLDPGPTP